jgi:nanoRNase/pAp phosphatase (c-di-AMP/oligoRNAs hydrolase)
MKQPIGKTVSFAEKLKRLHKIVSTRDILAVLVNADPDALASAMALKRLFWRRARRVVICRINKVDRTDNQAFIRMLDIQNMHIRRLKKAEVTKWALVDSQPSHNEAFAGVPFDIIIDHHPLTEGLEAPFIDIQPEYGAAATLMAEYLRAARIEPSPKLATALFYGIKSDTDDFVRGSVSRDIIVFRNLYERANLNIIKKIEASELSVKTLAIMKNAMENVSLLGKTAFVHMGAVDSPDHLVIVADFLMKLAEATWSVVSGIHDDKLVVIFRNAGFRRDAGRRAREAFGDLGSAGGHQSTARAEIPLTAIAAQAAGPTDYARFVRGRLKKSNR